MDNEQLNSNLNQLIINQDEIVKNQIEICEVIRDLTKQVKKIRKPKKPSNYDLNNIFGNPVEQLDKILFKQGGVFAKGSDQKKPFVCAGESIILPKQAEQLDKITCKQVNPDYICIVDLPEFGIKRGDVFRYSCRDNYVTIRDKQELRYCKDFFILHRDNFDNYEVKHATPRQDQTEIRKQANDLVDKFMPLVNGWNEDKPKYNECYQGAINEPIIGVWYYSKQNQRKAAIKCAIVHCELWWEKTFGCAAQEPLNIKEELQKMLSE